MLLIIVISVNLNKILLVKSILKLVITGAYDMRYVVDKKYVLKRQSPHRYSHKSLCGI